jgi:Raf kinase inhibitor-like YbhB/YbcL family protein
MTVRAKAKTRVAARTLTLTPVTATPTPQSSELPKIPDTPPTPPGFGTGSPPAMALGSGAFAPEGEIPVDYTCHGENTSPALDWSNLPQGTASLALTLTDPDSDPPGFVHWVAYEIQPQAGGLPPALPARDTLDDGILQGLNSFSATTDTAFPSGAAINKVGYDGPCPPSAHRYVFTLYALDQTPGLGPGASLDQLLQAMEGHILATAQLQARFAPPD